MPENQSPTITQVKTGLSSKEGLDLEELARVNLSRPNANSVSSINDGVIARPLLRTKSLGKAGYENVLLLHQGFADRLSESFSSWLTCCVDIHPVDCEIWSRARDSDTSVSEFCEFELESQLPATTWLVHIGRTFLIAFINKLLGVPLDQDNSSHRKLTPFECRLSKRMMQYFCVELQRVWQPFFASEWECHCREGMTPLHSPTAEEFIVVNFELEFAMIRDRLRICIPMGDYQGVEKRLSRKSIMDFGKSTRDTSEQVAASLDGSVATMIVNMAATTIKTSDIVGLQIGDVIATEVSIDAPLEVAVGNVVKFRALPGSFNRHKAIRVMETVSPGDLDTQ